MNSQFALLRLVSGFPGWSQTYYVAEGGLAFLTLLLLPPKDLLSCETTSSSIKNLVGWKEKPVLKKLKRLVI